MSERYELIKQNGQFYKANLHAHTTLSDGRLTPEESKKAYKERGYSILAITDHNRYMVHRELDDADFLTIASYEVDINDFPKIPGDFSRLKVYHFNLYDTNPDQNAEEKKRNLLPERRYSDINYINGYIERMNQLGFLVCYNHPYWSLQDYDDYKDLSGLFAMEIYNHGCEYDGLYGYHPQAYDEMLRTGQRLHCVATDDNHNVYDFDHPLCDSFGGFTMIKADALSYENVIRSLRQGDFYASTGPEIHELYIEDGKLHVTCSPAEKIFVIQEGRNCYKKLAAKGTEITDAEFELSGKEGYIRVDIRDSRGLHAYSNAYYLDDMREWG